MSILLKQQQQQKAKVTLDLDLGQNMNLYCHYAQMLPIPWRRTDHLGQLSPVINNKAFFYQTVVPQLNLRPTSDSGRQGCPQCPMVGLFYCTRWGSGFISNDITEDLLEEDRIMCTMNDLKENKLNQKNPNSNLAYFLLL